MNRLRNKNWLAILGAALLVLAIAVPALVAQQPAAEKGLPPPPIAKDIAKKAAPPPLPSFDDVTFEEVWITNPSTGVKWYCHVHQPKDASAEKKYPALAMVPGGDGFGSQLCDRGQAGWYAHQGFIVIHFDQDGRGKTTEGTIDYNGTKDQDGFHEVLKYLAKLPQVQADNIGVYTMSYGITLGASTLGRFPDDPPVKYLVDGEGPANRDHTGPGHGHLKHELADTDWWPPHEATTYMSKVKARYLRLQNEKDHVQPTNAHAILLVNLATNVKYGGKGVSPWTRVNGADLNEPNKVYTSENPPKYTPNLPMGGGGVEERTLKLIKEMADMPPLGAE